MLSYCKVTVLESSNFAHRYNTPIEYNVVAEN